MDKVYYEASINSYKIRMDTLDRLKKVCKKYIDEFEKNIFHNHTREIKILGEIMVKPYYEAYIDFKDGSPIRIKRVTIKGLKKVCNRYIDNFNGITLSINTREIIISKYFK